MPFKKACEKLCEDYEIIQPWAEYKIRSSKNLARTKKTRCWLLVLRSQFYVKQKCETNRIFKSCLSLCSNSHIPQLLDNMLEDFTSMVCKRSLKVLMLHAQLNKFENKRITFTSGHQRLLIPLTGPKQWCLMREST